MSEEGIKPPREKIKAITEFLKPKNIQELRRFLGIINFYRDSLPNAASIQAPLNAYLHNSKKRDKNKITWSIEADATMLTHPSSSTKNALSLMCAASSSCAGAVIQQRVNNKWIPLGHSHFSKKLSETQQRYSTFDRELLAIYMAVKYFRKIFERRELIIYTDHKPLTYAIHKPPSASDTQRRTRQLLSAS